MADDHYVDDVGGGNEGLAPDQNDLGGDVTGGGASGGFGVKGADDRGAGGPGPSDDTLLLSGSKEELSSSALGRSSDASPTVGRSETGDMFERLRHAQREPHGPAAADVAFSAQQQNDRWIVVFVVGGLYVFFYAMGGLAYYLLDVYGYTVDYSGRANHTTTGNPTTM